jgi:hypothetical protein
MEDNFKIDLEGMRACGLDSAGSGQIPVTGSCNHVNDLAGSMDITHESA